MVTDARAVSCSQNRFPIHSLSIEVISNLEVGNNNPNSFPRFAIKLENNGEAVGTDLYKERNSQPHADLRLLWAFKVALGFQNQFPVYQTPGD